MCFMCSGGNFDTLIEGQNCTVDKLLEELYEKVSLVFLDSFFVHF